MRQRGIYDKIFSAGCAQQNAVQAHIPQGYQGKSAETRKSRIRGRTPRRVRFSVKDKKKIKIEKRKNFVKRGGKLLDTFIINDIIGYAFIEV